MRCVGPGSHRGNSPHSPAVCACDSGGPVVAAPHQFTAPPSVRQRSSQTEISRDLISHDWRGGSRDWVSARRADTQVSVEQRQPATPPPPPRLHRSVPAGSGRPRIAPGLYLRRRGGAGIQSQMVHSPAGITVDRARPVPPPQGRGGDTVSDGTQSRRDHCGSRPACTSAAGEGRGYSLRWYTVPPGSLWIAPGLYLRRRGGAGIQSQMVHSPAGITGSRPARTSAAGEGRGYSLR